MKKRFFALVLSLVLVFSSAVTVFAASGVNSDEQALLDKFSGVVNSWASVLSTSPKDGGNIANQYIAEATNALMQVDLSADACNDLSTTIDAVVGIIEKNGCATRADLKAALPEILQTVNATSQKYGMTVSVDTSTGYATVTITTEKGDKTEAASTKAAVNQTGVDFTATLGVIAAVIFVFAFGVFMIRKDSRKSR